MNSRLTEFISRKRTAVVIAALVFVALLGWGGWKFSARLNSGPPTTAEVKRSIWKFLAKKAGTKKFTSAVNVAEASVSGSATVTNKAGKVKTVSKSKGGNFGLPETTLSAYFRTNQQQAGTYEQMYRLIGEQLKVTDQLLDSADPPARVTALIMAGEASGYARTNAEDLWLSARICEAYLWPNFSFVETNQGGLTLDALLTLCDVTFRDAGETNNMIRSFEYVIQKSSSTQQADIARFRLSRLYQGLGHDEEALKLLKEIKNWKSAKAEQDIAILERKLNKAR